MVLRVGNGCLKVKINLNVGTYNLGQGENLFQYGYSYLFEKGMSVTL